MLIKEDKKGEDKWRVCLPRTSIWLALVRRAQCCDRCHSLVTSISSSQAFGGSDGLIKKLEKMGVGSFFLPCGLPASSIPPCSFFVVTCLASRLSSVVLTFRLSPAAGDHSRGPPVR